ncbi:hypothetical protein EI94DRAFT_1739411 [Lactarius quietus]|nr:hypothetical protein EI94DRAFT_1739411 [Lactarius quietus]
MCIEEDSSIEHYTCAMPRYYAVPLILLNKRLAYFEGQCAPDGTPLPFVDGSQVLKLRGIKEYKRYGHDTSQRHAYWKNEIDAGRMPYSKLDIADMDWRAFLSEEIAASYRLNGVNAFLWNRVSQSKGYARLVQDDLPYASWQAWSRGCRSRNLDRRSVLHTPPPSSPERHSCSPEEPDDSAREEEGPLGPISNASPNNNRMTCS